MDLSLGTLAAAAVPALGWATQAVMSYRKTNIIKEAREALKELSDVPKAISAAKADGKITPEEVEVIGREISEAMYEVADLLDKGCAMLPGKVGVEARALRAKIPIVKGKTHTAMLDSGTG